MVSITCFALTDKRLVIQGRAREELNVVFFSLIVDSLIVYTSLMNQ
jgi:hypothetical protein